MVWYIGTDTILLWIGLSNIYIFGSLHKNYHIFVVLSMPSGDFAQYKHFERFQLMKIDEWWLWHCTIVSLRIKCQNPNQEWIENNFTRCRRFVAYDEYVLKSKYAITTIDLIELKDILYWYVTTQTTSHHI